MRKCSFCNSDNQEDKVILKLKPSMLQKLHLKQDTDYYACQEHFEEDAIVNGKRRRWSINASLTVNRDDLRINEMLLKGMKMDYVLQFKCLN